HAALIACHLLPRTRFGIHLARCIVATRVDRHRFWFRLGLWLTIVVDRLRLRLRLTIIRFGLATSVFIRCGLVPLTTFKFLLLFLPHRFTSSASLPLSVGIMLIDFVTVCSSLLAALFALLLLLLFFLGSLAFTFDPFTMSLFKLLLIISVIAVPCRVFNIFSMLRHIIIRFEL